jgi:hypothetical protein
MLDEPVCRPGRRPHQAVRLLQQVELEVDYADAWSEWRSSADREAWESSDGDGLAHASG